MGEPNDFRTRRAKQLRREGSDELAARLEKPVPSEHPEPDFEIDVDRALVARHFTENQQALLDAVWGDDMDDADIDAPPRMNQRQRREYMHTIGEQERDMYIALLQRNVIINTVLVSLRKTGYTPNTETLQKRQDIVRTMTNAYLYQLIMECPEDAIEQRVRLRPAFYEALIRLSQERGEEDITHSAYRYLSRQK